VKQNQKMKAIKLKAWLVVILVAGIFFVSGWLINYPRRGGKTNTKASNSVTVLAEIQDSGSTNTNGWYLNIFTNGGGKLTFSDLKKLPGPMPANKEFSVNTFNASQLEKDLNSTNLSSSYNCGRSVSFGSIETLIYKGNAVVGIDCYIDDNTTPLANDFNTILSKAGVN